MVGDARFGVPERIETPYGVFNALADDLITGQLLAFGGHTRNELAMVLDHVAEGDVFVDLGAHIGTFAVPIAQKLGSRGKLLAIEGAPETFRLLERNIGANGLAHRVQTRCVIVGEGDQQKLRRIEVGGNSGAGYYLPDPAGAVAAISARALLCTQGFARFDFLKIDVEGMEWAVLQDLAPLIQTRRPKLYIEVVASQIARFGATVGAIDAFLRAFGYRFYRNVGERNSSNDHYIKAELSGLEDGGEFFDLLALPE